ncbi:MAG: hypothetical protein CMJ59_01130 [Planctomycetaceae bacterium]|nr:hypothetical protein [Planctomycetaceae bacterium]
MPDAKLPRLVVTVLWLSRLGIENIYVAALSTYPQGTLLMFVSDRNRYESTLTVSCSFYLASEMARSRALVYSDRIAETQPTRKHCVRVVQRVESVRLLISR